jgi:hypothetical protein
MTVHASATYVSDPADSTDGHVELRISVINGNDNPIEQVQVEPQAPFGKPYGVAEWVAPVASIAPEGSDDVHQYVQLPADGDAPAVPAVKVTYVDGSGQQRTIEAT